MLQMQMVSASRALFLGQGGCYGQKKSVMYRTLLYYLNQLGRGTGDRLAKFLSLTNIQGMREMFSISATVNFGRLEFSVWDHNLIKKKYFSEFQIPAVNGHLRGDGRQVSNFSHCHKAGDRGQLN